MRNIVAVLATCLLTACASPGPTVTPVENGGNRADGIVTMSSTTSIFNAVGPDWRKAETGASDRCRRWGFGRQVDALPVTLALHLRPRPEMPAHFQLVLEAGFHQEGIVLQCPYFLFQCDQFLVPPFEDAPVYCR